MKTLKKRKIEQPPQEKSPKASRSVQSRREKSKQVYITINDIRNPFFIKGKLYEGNKIVAVSQGYGHNSLYFPAIVDKRKKLKIVLEYY